MYIYNRRASVCTAVILLKLIYAQSLQKKDDDGAALGFLPT